MSNWNRRYANENEICGCGNSAVGMDMNGRPACMEHSMQVPNDLSGIVEIPNDLSELPHKRPFPQKDPDRFSRETHGVKFSEQKEAENALIPKSDYLWARSQGHPHANVMEVHLDTLGKGRAPAAGLSSYVVRSNDGKMTHENYTEAKNAGIEPWKYLSATRDMPHDKIMNIHRQGSDPSLYNMYSKGSQYQPQMSHENALAKSKYNKTSSWVQRYAAEDTFGYGDPHYFEKLIDHANSGNPKLIQKKHVDFARAHGINEDEMMHAYTQGHNIGSYTVARRRNDPWANGPEALKPRTVATHDEAIDALNKNVDANHYSLLRTVGSTMVDGKHNPNPTPLSHEEAVARSGKMNSSERQRYF